MSTFNGLVDEFPDIRIDNFRSHNGARPPAACFLSHVHSDHLLGLESLKMPFVYCSAVTKNILLRMEKYPHRINFQKGILECRKQTYRHLSRVLRPLPLEAPVELELGPKLVIRVTLFDANHCPGAVMFLIEGSGKAILYTGDIRAESWWVNSLVRNPVLLPYCCGRKRLDCIYLDTTFASHDDIYRSFPTKAEGLKELLEKVDNSPVDSVFYFRAWTLGYEDVWVTLANHLRKRVHVDDYKLKLYASLAEDGVQQGAALVGTQVGNTIHPGCLSRDVNAAIHSCEPGMECHKVLKSDPRIVWITPIISRMSNGTEIAEVGAGGGSGDLGQVSELELADGASISALRTFCTSLLSNTTNVENVESVLRILTQSHRPKVSLEGLGLDQDREISLTDFVKLIATPEHGQVAHQTVSTGMEPRPQKSIHFPYSRHSSLSELRDLVARFRPEDICPCTVDLGAWSENVNMESLFGDLCSRQTFQHDARIREKVSAIPSEVRQSQRHRKRKRISQDSQETASQDSQQVDEDVRSSASNGNNLAEDNSGQKVIIVLDDDDDDEDGNDVLRALDDSHENSGRMSEISLSPSAFDSQQSQGKTDPNRPVRGSERLPSRVDAYHAAKQCLMDDEPSRWEDLHLRSCGWKGHTEEELVL